MSAQQLVGNRGFSFECDCCPAKFNPPHSRVKRDFDASWALAQREGWVYVEVKNGREFRCPECA